MRQREHALIDVRSDRRKEVAEWMRAFGRCRCGRAFTGSTQAEVREMYRDHRHPESFEDE